MKKQVVKVSVRYNGTTKAVRAHEVFCDACAGFRLQVCLKPSVFDERLKQFRTTKVCLGCRDVGRYDGQVAHRFEFGVNDARFETGVAAFA